MSKSKRKNKRKVITNKDNKKKVVITKNSVANELCERMCDGPKKKVVVDQKLEKSLKEKEKCLRERYKKEKQEYECEKNKWDEIEKEYILNDESIFYAIVEMTDKIYANKNASDDDIKIGEEAFEKTKEIYTDAALHFPKCIGDLIKKGLNIIKENPLPLSLLMNVVKNILDIENKMTNISAPQINTNTVVQQNNNVQKEKVDGTYSISYSDPATRPRDIIRNNVSQNTNKNTNNNNEGLTARKIMMSIAEACENVL